MNFNEYQELSCRTAPKEEYWRYEFANYGLGIAGEAGEVADLIKKALYHGHDIPVKDLKKELGDVLWYLTQIARVNNLSLEDIAIENIEKLKKRYPDGFSQEASINRED